MHQGPPSAWLVVIGASAGGIDALSQLVATLPRSFPAPIVIA
jgi:chemotaxis response regulator CheB